MSPPDDQTKRDQFRDHIAGLDSAAASVETALATRPRGAERDQMAALAERLRRSADQLRDELEALGRPPPDAPAKVGASARG